MEADLQAPTSTTENAPEQRFSEERQAKAPARASKKIFIGGLTYGIKEEEVEVRLFNIKEMFEKFGRITSLKIRSKNQTNTFAFIEYCEEEDAVKAKEAMDNNDFDGKQLTVQYSFGKDKPQSNPERSFQRNDRDNRDGGF